MNLSQNDLELEVKFPIESWSDLIQIINIQNYKLIQSRVYEKNLRFDTKLLDLTRSHQVLRLRQDRENRLTYKGKSEIVEGIQSRQEIEVNVNDFLATQRLLEALGYEVIMIYEKYRTTYLGEDTLICLDEMPFGNYLEIESNEVQKVKSMSEILGLNWENRILDSYVHMFEEVKQKLGLSFRDLTFDNFSILSP